MQDEAQEAPAQALPQGPHDQDHARRARKINLRKPFRKKKLPVGTRVRVTITAPGFIGKRFTYTMRKRKVPKRVRQCIPPGGKPGKCS